MVDNTVSADDDMKARKTRKQSRRVQAPTHVSETWSNAYHKWAQQFTIDAIADNYAAFKEELVHLDLSAKPKDMLQATLLVVQACLIYGSALDGQQYQRFLRQQSYQPDMASGVRYTLTFDLGKKHFGRVLATARLKYIDLADLFDHSWMPYKTAGYSRILFSRLDHKDFASPSGEWGGKELSRLENMIQSDLRYDYTEEEVDFSFDQMNTGVATLNICDLGFVKADEK